MRNNWIRAGGALLALTMVSAIAPPAEKHPKVGDIAPDFIVFPVEGKKITLADLKGQVVILNLWATWCAPCRKEMPTLDLLQANGGKMGLQVIGIITNDTVTRGQIWSVQKSLRYPLSLKSLSKYPAIGDAVPTNYVIDRKGVIRYALPAALDTKSFAHLVAPLLDEKP